MGLGFAILVGVFFAWFALQMRFHATWIFFFNVLLSVYFAVFATPVVLDGFPFAATLPFGVPLTLVGVFFGSLCVTYGITYACVAGQFYVELSKIPDTIIASILGFFSGVLIASFLLFAISLTPLANIGFLQQAGFHKDSQKFNRSYLCFWCNRMHGFVGASDQKCKDVLDELMDKVPAEESPAPSPEPEEESKPIIKPVLPVPPSPESTKPEPTKVVEEPTETKHVADLDAYPEPTGNIAEAYACGRVRIDSPDQLGAAIAKEEIKIIELANQCTVDKFQEEQITQLKDWVSNGGVLWAKNDVLAKFEIEYSTPSKNVAVPCRVEKSKDKTISQVVFACQQVTLKDFHEKAYILPKKGEFSLLTAKANVSEEIKADTTCWSMVHYGKGWVSDPKVVDVSVGNGKLFWDNFCIVCLGMPFQKRRAEPGDPFSQPLSGIWVAQDNMPFYIHDDGAVVTGSQVKHTEAVQFADFKLIRNYLGDETVEGEMIVTFQNSRERHTVQMAITLINEDTIRVHFARWPQWDSRGKKTLKKFDEKWIFQEKLGGGKR